jgi:hypothetical protein
LPCLALPYLGLTLALPCLTFLSQLLMDLYISHRQQFNAHNLNNPTTNSINLSHSLLSALSSHQVVSNISSNLTAVQCRAALQESAAQCDTIKDSIKLEINKFNQIILEIERELLSCSELLDHHKISLESCQHECELKRLELDESLLIQQCITRLISNVPQQLIKFPKPSKHWNEFITIINKMNKTASSSSNLNNSKLLLENSYSPPRHRLPATSSSVSVALSSLDKALSFGSYSKPQSLNNKANNTSGDNSNEITNIPSVIIHNNNSDDLFNNVSIDQLVLGYQSYDSNVHTAIWAAMLSNRAQRDKINDELNQLIKKKEGLAMELNEFEGLIAFLSQQLDGRVTTNNTNNNSSSLYYNSSDAELSGRLVSALDSSDSLISSLANARILRNEYFLELEKILAKAAENNNTNIVQPIVRLNQ